MITGRSGMVDSLRPKADLELGRRLRNIVEAAQRGAAEEVCASSFRQEACLSVGGGAACASGVDVVLEAEVDLDFEAGVDFRVWGQSRGLGGSSAFLVLHADDGERGLHGGAHERAHSTSLPGGPVYPSAASLLLPVLVSFLPIFPMSACTCAAFIVRAKATRSSSVERASPGGPCKVAAPVAFLPPFHLALDIFAIQTRVRLRLNEPDALHEPTVIAAAPEEHPDSPNDANDDNNNISDLPLKKHIQLAVAATQAKLMSEHKAATYYGVPRTTVKRGAKGILTCKDPYIHERSLTPAQEDILAEWIKKSLGKRRIPLSLPTIGTYAAEIYGALWKAGAPRSFDPRRLPDKEVGPWLPL
ncbi:hypothetical protein B0H14DRAFT_3483955 [Mycena olivaceomarginata]|nr:hypothetical protein B0H14DRAFT_3483955 [Mycena olivaceomarginata]